MTKRNFKKITAIIVATLFMGVTILPSSIKASFPDAPLIRWFKDHKVILGLDLQGGTQLDYRIDLRSVEQKNSDEDPANDVEAIDIIEGVRNTIERRVNGLGVSEPQIYLSSVGDEQHIIVELAGIKDIEEAKKTVGKTIQLEFKEQRPAGESDELSEQIRQDANDALAAVRAGQNFTELGKRVQTGDGKIKFNESKVAWEGNLPASHKDILANLKNGDTHRSLIEGENEYSIGLSGNLVATSRLYLVQRISAETKDRTTKEKEEFDAVAKELTGKDDVNLNGKTLADFTEAEGDAIWATPEGQTSEILEVNGEYRVYKTIKQHEADKEIRASHILISYKGAERANADVTRTKEEAKQKADELSAQLKENPDLFTQLAVDNSDDPAGPQGGDLNFFKRGVMTKAFEDAAFALKVDDISNVVETEFGYHIIKKTDERDTEDKVDVQLMSSTDKSALEAALARTVEHDVTKQETEYTFNEIAFDITPDPWKPTGLDGAHFKVATVVYDTIGTPQVSVQFDNEGARLFEELTERLVQQPIAIFVGGQLISAPTVQQKISGGSAVITGNFNLQQALQLATDLNTGAIDAPIILSGQYTISATLGENALKVSLWAGVIGFILLTVFMVLYYRLLGVFAILALAVYSVMILFVLNIFPIVMTLAGIAGIILSIGMAVDANILIFERTREELNDGKNFSAALSAGFERAWDSIRDSNVSSLITCAILWFFGNSIIRGFALMLAIGILISMFTAITITKTFLQALEGTSLARNRFLLGSKK